MLARVVLLLCLTTAAGAAARASILFNPGLNRLVRESTSGDSMSEDAFSEAPRSGNRRKALPELPGSRPTGAWRDHTVFENRAQAIAWAKRVGPRFKEALATKVFSVVDALDDPRYPVLQGYVHDTWAVYKKLFPEAVGTLPEPELVLVKTDSINAFILPDPETKRIGHAVLVFTGLIDALGGLENRSAYTGIIAHEIAHSVFLHLLPKYQGAFDHFYRQSPAGEVLGYEARPNVALKREIEKWTVDTALAGAVNLEENLPIASPVPFSSLLMTLGLLGESEFKNASPACAKELAPALKDWLAGWDDFPGPALEFDPVTGELRLVSGFDKAAAALSAKLDACASLPAVKAKRRPFRSYVEGPFSAPLDAAAKAYDAAPDAAAGLKAAIGVLRADMSKLAREIDFPTLGWFTWEEHADDASGLVNYAMNQNTGALSDALNILMSRLAPEQEGFEACRDGIASGTVPTIGAIEDPHHGTCYRSSNITRLDIAIHKFGFDEILKRFRERSLSASRN